MKSIQKLSAALLLLSTSVWSQTFRQYLNQENKNHSLNDVQQAFDQWAKGKNLHKTKGWKSYKRWENEQIKYVNSKGILPDPEAYLNAFLNASQQRQRGPSGTAQNASWMPLGPVSPPLQGDSLGEYNMGRVNCVAFHPKDPKTIFVGVAQGGVWKSSNNGLSWMPLTDNSLPILRISDIAIDPNCPDTMYIAVGDFEYIGFSFPTTDKKRNSYYGLGVYKTMDGGTTWNPTGLTFNQTQLDGSLTRRVLILPSNTENLLAATTSGMYKSTNGGLSWNKTLDSLMWDLVQDPNRPNVLYAASGFVSSLNEGSAGIYKSTDFGSTWKLLNTGIPARNAAQRIKIAIAPTDTNFVYALACDINDGFYGIYRSVNAGATWTLQANSPNLLGWDNGVAAGGQGDYDLSLLVHPKNKNTLYLGGVDVWGSTNGGVSWDGIAENTYGHSKLHVDEHFFAYNKSNTTYYICNDGGLYTTDSLIIGQYALALQDANSGSAYIWPTYWNNISSSLAIRSFYRIGLSTNNPGFAICGAQDNGTAYVDNTNTWYTLFGGDGMKGLIHPDSTNIMFFSSEYGYFCETTDGGNTIQNVNVGNTEKGDWTTPMIWNPNTPDTMYSAFGNVWVSGDVGQTWNPISNFPILNGFGYPQLSSAMAVAPTNTNYIYVCKRAQYQYSQMGEVWITKNNGTSWQNITAGLPDSLFFTYFAISNSDPNTAWITCAGISNGAKVFRTNDAGATWQNISYNLPNISANCVVQQAGTTNNALYVGTDLGIYYINDDLTTWQSYNTNLPNVIVTDLAIEYSTQKLYATTFGRGLWISDLQNLSTSIKNNPAENLKVEVYPSVGHGTFTLSIANTISLKYTLQVIDITGREVYTEELPMQASSYTKNYDLILNSGMYFIALSAGNTTKASKLIVER